MDLREKDAGADCCGPAKCMDFPSREGRPGHRRQGDNGATL